MRMRDNLMLLFAVVDDGVLGGSCVGAKIVNLERESQVGNGGLSTGGGQA